ncbi:MAG: endolytic transglycosylase MltG, partial [Flavobacteriales bacterium]
MYIKKILLAILIIGLVAGGVFAFMVYNAVFAPNTKFNNKEAYVFVRTDDDFNNVKEMLTPLINNMSTFEKVAERKGYASNVRGGKYLITKGMNNNDIVNTLRSKNIPIRVSFNNQETLADLAGRISAQLEPDSLTLLNDLNDPDFLKANGFTNETKLAMYIPNSYEFFWNSSPETFRDRMLKEYERFWNADRRQKAKRIGMTPNEVITLASIVHKETAKVDERPRVAGVYLNRLKVRMLLQADPT